MRYTPAIQGASIILLGNFNPAIFTPAWIELHGIIPDFQSITADIQIIHGEYAEFSFKNTHLVIQPERFSIEVTDEPFVQALDFILGTFGNVLPHTPIRQLGINFLIHFAVDSFAQRQRLGHALAPTSPWGPWGEAILASDTVKDRAGGMRSLTMQETAPDGRAAGGYRRVQIEPSVKEDVLPPNVGVYMAVNDHFMVEPDQTAHVDASKALTILNEKFDLSITKAKMIVSDLMEFASKLK